MILDNLESGLLVTRRKRFLVDVELAQGQITAHCPNTGSMKGLLESGTVAYLSRARNPERKYPQTLELLQLPQGTWAMVNTSRANDLVEEALQQGWVHGLPHPLTIQREVPCSPHSRMDFRLQIQEQTLWIEVKNVTLSSPDNPTHSQFPDAVTVRGLKHLQELEALVQQGHRAAILFLISRSDAHSFSPASHIDPHYAAALKQACQNGVEVITLKIQFQHALSNSDSQSKMQLEARDSIPWSLE